MSQKGIAPKRGPLGFLLIWTIGWCAICFPMAFMAWAQPAPWGVRLFMIPFVLIGLGALYFTLRLHQKRVLSRGVRLVLSDLNPRVGESLHAELLLPYKSSRRAWLQKSSLALQLVQYEEDRSGSGVSLIRSHALEQAVRPEQLTDGSWRLATRFDVPANAPATGAVRHGNAVVWQIELHEAEQTELVSFIVRMRAGQSDQGATESPWPAADEGEGRFHLEEIAALDIGQQPQAVAHSIARLEENFELWRAVFPRKAWRFCAVILATGSVAAVWWARNLWHANAGVASLAEGLVVWLLACSLIIASLHAWTKRWHLVVRDEGFTVDKSSALFKRVQEFGALQAQPLRYSLVYETSGARQLRVWHFSAVLPEALYGRKIAITPALPGAHTCAAVVHHFWHALAHRRMRFTAPADGGYSGLGPSAWQRLSAWSTVLLTASLFLVFTSLSPKTQFIDALKPAVIIDQTRQQLQRLHPKNIMLSRKRDALLNAHRANQLQELAQALSSGADANALDDDGMPLLIDAARLGHMELVRAYLQHGANINIRHTANPNNHGDTALLVALHRGHWDAAQLLITSGADLKVKNRWDWGAMHMAAQSDCVKCLEELLALGFSPNEPALASRGESPVMLAAGKDKLPALKWLVSHGGSLEQKDPHGNDALAWAQFFKRTSTTDWIREHSAQLPGRPQIAN